MKEESPRSISNSGNCMEYSSPSALLTELLKLEGQVGKSLDDLNIQLHPEQAPHGPDDLTGFMWRGKFIDLKGASLRRRLLVALWDTERRCPSAPRQVTEVMENLWPDDDASDGKLKDLIYRVNGKFQKAGMMLSVHQGDGLIWLKEGL